MFRVEFIRWSDLDIDIVHSLGEEFGSEDAAFAYAHPLMQDMRNVGAEAFRVVETGQPVSWAPRTPPQLGLAR